MESSFHHHKKGRAVVMVVGVGVCLAVAGGLLMWSGCGTNENGRAATIDFALRETNLLMAEPFMVCVSLKNCSQQPVKALAGRYAHEDGKPCVDFTIHLTGPDGSDATVSVPGPTGVRMMQVEDILPGVQPVVELEPGAEKKREVMIFPGESAEFPRQPGEYRAWLTAMVFTGQGTPSTLDDYQEVRSEPPVDLTISLPKRKADISALPVFTGKSVSDVLSGQASCEAGWEFVKEHRDSTYAKYVQMYLRKVEDRDKEWRKAEARKAAEGTAGFWLRKESRLRIVVGLFVAVLLLVVGIAVARSVRKRRERKASSTNLVENRQLTGEDEASSTPSR